MELLLIHFLHGKRGKGFVPVYNLIHVKRIIQFTHHFFEEFEPSLTTAFRGLIILL